MVSWRLTDQIPTRPWAGPGLQWAAFGSHLVILPQIPPFFSKVTGTQYRLMSVYPCFYRSSHLYPRLRCFCFFPILNKTLMAMSLIIFSLSLPTFRHFSNLSYFQPGGATGQVTRHELLDLRVRRATIYKYESSFFTTFHQFSSF